MTNSYFTITERPNVQTSELLAKCKTLFPVLSYYDDTQLDKDFPPPKKATTRYFRKNIEADKNLANKSAEELEKDNVSGVTLRERIIMELEYFKETGKHLDIINITLCTGSRDVDGSVPDADWYGGKFGVGWACPGSRGPSLRSRAAVSVDTVSTLPSPPSSDLEERVAKLEETLKHFNLHLP